MAGREEAAKPNKLTIVKKIMALLKKRGSATKQVEEQLWKVELVALEKLYAALVKKGA